jgi:hypothetical protein
MAVPKVTPDGKNFRVLPRFPETSGGRFAEFFPSGGRFAEFGPSIRDRAALLSAETVTLSADDRKRIDAYASAVSAVTKNLEARSKQRHAPKVVREVGDVTATVTPEGGYYEPLVVSPTLGLVLGFVGARTLIAVRAAKQSKPTWFEMSKLSSSKLSSSKLSAEERS